MRTTYTRFIFDLLLHHLFTTKPPIIELMLNCTVRTTAHPALLCIFSYVPRLSSGVCFFYKDE
jgi:hypothetical protein